MEEADHWWLQRKVFVAQTMRVEGDSLGSPVNTEILLACDLKSLPTPAIDITKLNLFFYVWARLICMRVLVYFIRQLTATDLLFSNVNPKMQIL